MLVTELVCLLIVGFYVGMRLRGAEDGRGFLLRFGVMVVAAAIGENSMIALYEAYEYAPAWSLSVGHVPVIVVLVWPVVVDSALVLASHLAPAGTSVRALVAAGVVLMDALLIEPIAVFAGLWAWSEGELFDVPLLGVAGWAFFTWGAGMTLERTRGLSVLSVLVTGPAAAHGLVLAAHWTVFRWVRFELSETAAIVIAWVLALSVTAALLRWSRRSPRGAVLLRAPGALFFFALLALGEGESRGVLAWFAAPFSIPYWVLLRRGERARGELTPERASGRADA